MLGAQGGATQVNVGDSSVTMVLYALSESEERVISNFQCKA
jgi:hypothetical protein